MSKTQFKLLCETMEDKVGKNNFWPKDHEDISYVCGKMKVTVGLRMMFGGIFANLNGQSFDIIT